MILPNHPYTALAGAQPRVTPKARDTPISLDHIQKHHIDLAPISKDGDYFNDVYKYDIQTSMWGSVPMNQVTFCITWMCEPGCCQQVHTLGEAPTKRTDHSVVLFRDSLLVFGGFDGHNRLGRLGIVVAKQPHSRQTCLRCSCRNWQVC